MNHTSSELSYAIRWRVIAKYAGQICMVMSVLTAVPAVVSLCAGDIVPAVWMFVVTIIAGIVGIAGTRITAPLHIQQNEALVISSLTFLVVGLAMSFPLMAYGLDFEDAFFESVSGVTTTGLTTLTNLADQPKSLLFCRAWMQWYGGLGIVVFSVALITRSGVAAKRLALLDSSDKGLLGGVKLHALRVLIVYSGLTLVGIAAIALFGVGATNAILYSFAAVSTGGFAPNSTLAELGGWPVQITILMICLAGALPISLYYRTYREGWRTLVQNRQVHALLIVTLVVSAFLFLTLRSTRGQSLTVNVTRALLLGASAQTTAGFEPMQVASLNDASKLVLLFPMLIGGCVGSSAGGLKLLRLLILLQLLRTAILKSGVPRHAVVKPELFGEPLPQKEIEEASLIFFAYFALIACSWLSFVSMGYPVMDSLFEVTSACGTVGLSSGVTSSELPTILKLVLCIDMLLGRLEIFAWLVVLSPRTWFATQVDES